jgi:hypothetical protein
MTPLYRTIVMEMLQDRPALHETLRINGTLLESMEHLAAALRACHLSRIDELEEARPKSHPDQLSSEALEMALQELASSLPPASDTTETLSLDGAMTFLHRHMPAE